MQGITQTITQDPTMMFAFAVAAVILLFVLLVVIVATMRVRSYRMRFENLRIDTIEKEKKIETLQAQLGDTSLKNAQYTQELKHFGDVKERLMDKESKLAEALEQVSQLKSELSQTQAQLQATKERLEALQEEHRALLERFEAVSDENNKLRINNARLVTKLETDARLNGKS